MQELKSCPYCGGAEAQVDYFQKPPGYIYFVTCKACDKIGPVATNPVHAIFAWNGLRPQTLKSIISREGANISTLADSSA